jgi:hypothetical protein
MLLEPSLTEASPCRTYHPIRNYAVIGVGKLPEVVLPKSKRAVESRALGALDFEPCGFLLRVKLGSVTSF